MTSPSIPTTEHLLEIVNRMDQVRVLLLADLVLDRFIVGRPSRISREAPVLILQQEDDLLTAGGGGNAAVAAAVLNAQVCVAGALGSDAEGDSLLGVLQEFSVDTSLVQCLEAYQTPTKTRVVGHGTHAMPQQIVRFDREGTVPNGIVLPELTDKVDLVLVSDYGYGAATPEILASLQASLESDVPTLVDSRYRLAQYSGITGATPNQEEVERIFDASIEDQPVDAAHRLRRQLDCQHLLLTRGSEGMILALNSGTAKIPVHGGSQVADVTGAGDTVMAAYGVALAAGAEPLAAALIANYAGGVVVTKAGTATVDRSELNAAIKSDPEPISQLQWLDL